VAEAVTGGGIDSRGEEERNERTTVEISVEECCPGVRRGDHSFISTSFPGCSEAVEAASARAAFFFASAEDWRRSLSSWSSYALAASLTLCLDEAALREGVERAGAAVEEELEEVCRRFLEVGVLVEAEAEGEETFFLVAEDEEVEAEV
jgi:hypothetical protein